jgi:hypothetical protein
MFDITDPAFMGFIFECEEKKAEKRRKEYEQYLQNNIKEKEEDDE